jgi:hypothetical protein
MSMVLTGSFSHVRNRCLPTHALLLRMRLASRRHHGQDGSFGEHDS